jgi:hypothetical protein
MTLIKAFSMEILLVDQNTPIKRDNTTFGDVLEDGVDEDLEDLMQHHLDPANRVKETCMLLTGLTTMIMDLADAPPDSEGRRCLAQHVNARLKDTLGEPATVSGESLAEMRRIHNGAPQRCIAGIFGLRIKFENAEGPVMRERSSGIGEGPIQTHLGADMQMNYNAGNVPGSVRSASDTAEQAESLFTPSQFLNLSPFDSHDDSRMDEA